MPHLCLAALALVVAAADAYPLQQTRRTVRSASNLYLPEEGARYFYPEQDYDQDYEQEQWFDAAAQDPATNAAFLQNLMEANKYNERLERLGLPGLYGPPYGRYLDPRYKDSDDYIFGSVTSSGPSRYQYDQSDDDDDADVRALHALAKKSRPDPSSQAEYEAQATEAILGATLRRQRQHQLELELERELERELEEQEAQRLANQRAEEFAGEGNAMAPLDQGLERLFAKSGIPNAYRDRREPRPWNGKDPVWNGYNMAVPDVGVEMPKRASRDMKTTSSATSSTTPSAPTTTTTTTTSTSPPPTMPTPAPMKRTLSAGQMSGQPEVALLRPAAARPAPRPATRSARPRTGVRPAHHQGGVDEIRNLLHVQDALNHREAGVDLLSLLPAITKRSAKQVGVVTDEASLVDELNALKKKSD